MTYQEYKDQWSQDTLILIKTDKLVFVNSRSNSTNKVFLERIIPIADFNRIWEKRKHEYKLMTRQEIKDKIKSNKLNNKAIRVLIRSLKK